jgi:hypothetical protein
MAVARMDQAFLLRARKLLEQRPLTPFSHRELLAAVASQQEARPTALMAARCQSRPANGETEALAALLLAEAADVPKSADSLCACFSRAVAARRVNTR